VSVPNVLSKDMVKSMNEDPFIFAMSNPDPEILPEDAKEAGASVVATGRSDYPNQINNVLAFPGLFRGALDARLTRLTTKMFVTAAKAIADSVEDLSVEKIIPSPFDERVPKRVAEAIKESAE
ncbi:MAG TPA: NAD-dependent malic enzyme, partial [Balneolaceae bacterium]|nr:NAD-dependent malic enzyme [Balneolaceae bacterium]